MSTVHGATIQEILESLDSTEFGDVLIWNGSTMSGVYYSLGDDSWVGDEGRRYLDSRDIVPILRAFADFWSIS